VVLHGLQSRPPPAYAVLTEAGRAAREAWPIYAQGIRDYFACQLTDGELSVLAEALGRVYEAGVRTQR
jgi:hypothetical protein